MSNVSALESEIKSTLQDSSKDLKRQILALEEAQKRSSQSAEAKAEKDLLREQMLKINEVTVAQQAQIAQLNQQIAALNQQIAANGQTDAKTYATVQSQIEKLHAEQQKFNLEIVSRFH